MPEQPLVLIVDDHASQLRLTEFTLMRLGFSTLTAEHPRDALELLKHNTPDLIVLDVNLPDMSGLDIAGRLRAVSRLKNVPVILVTSHRTPSVVEQAKWEGSPTVLQKPLRSAEFEQAVRTAVPSLADSPVAFSK